MNKLLIIIMENMEPLINIKICDPFVCVQTSMRREILLKCPYFTKMLTYFKENTTNEILMEVIDSRLTKIIIESLLNKELNIYDPDNGPGYSKWKYLLLYKCCDFLGVDFDKSILYDLSVHKIGFNLLLDVIDMIGYDKFTIQLLINNLPPDYNLRKFPKELLEAIRLQPTSYIIATGSEDRTIKLYRISTKRSTTNYYFDKSIRYYPTDINFIMSNKIKYISYLNNNQIISCDEDNILRIWNTATSDLIKEILDTENTIINLLNLSPDKKICALDGNNIKIFDLNTCTWMNKSINLKVEFTCVDVYWLSCTKIILGYNVGIIEIRDIEDDVIIKNWEDFFDTIHLSPDGSQFAISSYTSDLIKIYDSNSYELITFIESTNDIKNFTYSPTDDLIVSINWSNVIEIWNCRTGLLIKKFEDYYNLFYNQNNKNNIEYVLFSPTGDHLIISNKNRIMILDWVSGEEILSFDTHNISDLCLVPDFNNNLINRINKILG
ncbi:WD-repeat family protein [Saudi moumouvirus]|nr:WD-repeat family protein [Saudi moumouvirus]